MAGPGIFLNSGLFLFSPILIQFVFHLNHKRLWFLFTVPILTQTFGHFAGYVNCLTPKYNYAIFIIGLALAVLYLIPFWIDSFVQRKFNSLFLRLITLPALLTSVSSLLTFFSPFGSWTDIGNTMTSFLEIHQLASFFGLSGITFFVGFIASAINYLVDTVLSPDTTSNPSRKAVATLLFSVIAVTVLACNIHPMSRHRGLFPPLSAACIVDGDLPTTELVAATLGPDIIIWSEHSVTVWGEKGEAELLAKAQLLAKNYSMLLGVTYTLMLDSPPTPTKVSANVFSVITPIGDVGFIYRKSHLIPGAEERHVPGPPNLPFLDTPWGARVGGSICFDFDFPQYIRQAGVAGVDIMLQPSWTWEPLSVAHAMIDIHRSVEQGFTTFRCSKGGTSAVVDPLGRVLATAYDVPSSDPPRRHDILGNHTLLFADIPALGVNTLYTAISDAFLCIFGFTLSIVILILIGTPQTCLRSILRKRWSRWCAWLVQLHDTQSPERYATLGTVPPHVAETL